MLAMVIVLKAFSNVFSVHRGTISSSTISDLTHHRSVFMSISLFVIFNAFIGVLSTFVGINAQDYDYEGDGTHEGQPMAIGPSHHYQSPGTQRYRYQLPKFTQFYSHPAYGGSVASSQSVPRYYTPDGHGHGHGQEHHQTNSMDFLSSHRPYLPVGYEYWRSYQQSRSMAPPHLASMPSMSTGRLNRRLGLNQVKWDYFAHIGNREKYDQFNQYLQRLVNGRDSEGPYNHHLLRQPQTLPNMLSMDTRSNIVNNLFPASASSPISAISSRPYYLDSKESNLIRGSPSYSSRIHSHYHSSQHSDPSDDIMTSASESDFTLDNPYQMQPTSSSSDLIEQAWSNIDRTALGDGYPITTEELSHALNRHRLNYKNSLTPFDSHSNRYWPQQHLSHIHGYRPTLMQYM